MRDDEGHGLTEKERAAMAALSRDVPAPGELEERVVGALRDQRLIRPRRSWQRTAAVAATLAASLLLAFSLGISVGMRGDSAIAGDQASFALFVFDPVEATPGADQQAAVTAAGAWAAELADAGVLVGAEKLRDEGRRLAVRGGEVTRVADVPPPGDALVLGGLFLIRAASLEEAQRIAAECPLLQFGSTIEIRAFERMP